MEGWRIQNFVSAVLTNFCVQFKSCYSYDDAIEDLVDDADPTCIATCTIDGEVDPGCVIDCEVLGTEAAELFIEIEENAPEVIITEPPTSGPTSAPTEPTGLGTEDGTLSESSGSQGDPHCKFSANFIF